MNRRYDWEEPEELEQPSGPVHFGSMNITGSGIQIGTNQRQTNHYATPPAVTPADAPPERAARTPENTLYAYADIVGYSRLNARLQEESQDRLVRVLDASLAEAGISPGTVTAQDQGDARLLRFPAGADAGRVLAVMPRHLHGEVTSRNEFMAPEARMRVRLAFAMGISIQGRSGLVGNAPIAVVRLANAERFKSAMAAVPEAASGVIVDDYLYSEYIRQDFRPDMEAGQYLKLVVEDEAKGFTAQAWLRLPGCEPRLLAKMLA